MDNLVGTAEIAQRLGRKSPEIVLTWIRRYKDGEHKHPFPAPVKRLQIGLVFHWPDVERWAKATGRDIVSDDEG